MNGTLAARRSSPFRSVEHSRKARNCASKVLRPLLRVLRAAGLSKTELIEVCEKNIQELSERARPSRIRSLPHHVPLEEIVSRWANDPAYLDQGGSMRLRVRGKKPNVQSLVKSVAPKLSPKLVLRALKRSRVVRVTKDGKVELLSRFYSARKRGTVDLEFFTNMTTDFLRTQEFNFLKNPPMGHGLFQRRAHKVNSAARLAPVFNRYVREQGQLFLEAIDEWLVRHQPKNGKSRRKKRVRLGVGIYVINEALR